LTAEEHLKNETNESMKKLNTESAESQSKNNINNLEEDIDFLLSLKEPVQNNPTTITQSISISHNTGKRSYIKKTIFISYNSVILQFLF